MARYHRATDYELWAMRRDGFSYREIASYYGLNVDSIRGRVSRYAHTLSGLASRTEAGRRHERIMRWIADDNVADALGIDRQWIERHIDVTGGLPLGRNIERRSGYSNEREVLKRAIGSGIEDAMYIWYDEDDDLWYYGVDEDEVSP